MSLFVHPIPQDVSVLFVGEEKKTFEGYQIVRDKEEGGAIKRNLRGKCP